MSQVFAPPVKQETKRTATTKTLRTIEWKQVKFVGQALVAFTIPVAAIVISIVNDGMYLSEILPAALILLLIAFVKIASERN